MRNTEFSQNLSKGSSRSLPLSKAEEQDISLPTQQEDSSANKAFRTSQATFVSFKTQCFNSLLVKLKANGHPKTVP